MKNLIYLVILTMTLFSCKKNSDDKDCCFYSKHLMPAYMIPDSIKTESFPIRDNKHCIEIGFYGEIISYFGIGNPNFNEETKENYQKKFEELSIRYGDTAYYSYVDIAFQPALSYPLNHISITSDKDFDENHPKGSDLSDIAECKMSSYYHHIKENYNIDNDYYSYCLYNEYCITKKIIDLTDEDLKIIGSSNVYIIFPDIDLNSVHNITITLYFENGVIMSNTIPVDFGYKSDKFVC